MRAAIDGVHRLARPLLARIVPREGVLHLPEARGVVAELRLGKRGHAEGLLRWMRPCISQSPRPRLRAARAMSSAHFSVADVFPGSGASRTRRSTVTQPPCAGAAHTACRAAL